MMKKLSILLMLSTVGITQIFAQQKYGEMSLSEIEEISIGVVRTEDLSVLVVVSEVPEMKFESNIGIPRVRQISESEWWVYLRSGRQIITIMSEGYLSVKTDVFNFQNKRAYEIKVSQVRPVPGQLFIKTLPDSANLRINGAPIDAVTPYRIEEAPPGSYYVQIIKQGYRQEEKTVTVESGTVTEWEVELVQTAVRVQIDIEEDLQDVGIIIDGEAIGVAPGAIYLEPGSYQLQLQKPGYKHDEKVIEITLDQNEITLLEKLVKIKSPFYSKWWFLTGTAAAITGSAVFLLGSGGQAEGPLPVPPNFPK